MKKQLIASIRNKEIQLAKLEEHIYKSNICSDLYDKVLIEKAILNKQLKDLKNKTLVNKIKHLFSQKDEKLICDYFKG